MSRKKMTISGAICKGITQGFFSCLFGDIFGTKKRRKKR